MGLFPLVGIIEMVTKRLIKYFIQGTIESVQMSIRQLEQADVIRVESKRKIKTIKASSKATKLLH